MFSSRGGGGSKVACEVKFWELNNILNQENTVNKKEEIILTFEESDHKIKGLEIILPSIFKASLYVTNE